MFFYFNIKESNFLRTMFKKCRYSYRNIIIFRKVKWFDDFDYSWSVLNVISYELIIYLWPLGKKCYKSNKNLTTDNVNSYWSGISKFWCTSIISWIDFYCTSYMQLGSSFFRSFLHFKTNASPGWVIVKSLAIPEPRDCAHIFRMSVNQTGQTDCWTISDK